MVAQSKLVKDDDPNKKLSAAERARKHWVMPGSERLVKLSELGILDVNRGKLGVSVKHAHRLCCDVIQNLCSTARYRLVMFFTVPQHRLEEWREWNKSLCDASNLMPPWSPTMDKACVIRNHFTTCLKILENGRVKLDGMGEVLKARGDDGTLQAIFKDGIKCIEIDAAIWDEDPDGLAAIMNEDNLEATSAMGTNEMEVIGEIAEAIQQDKDHKDTKGDKAGRSRRVKEKLRKKGLVAQYPAIDVENWMSLADAIGLRIARGMMHIHFCCVNPAVIRVSSKTLRLIAGLDVKARYVKVALALYVYCGPENTKTLRAKLSDGSLVMGVPLVATTLSDALLRRLQDSIFHLMPIENFMRAVFTHVANCPPGPLIDGTKVLHAKKDFFVDCGKLLVGVKARDERADYGTYLAEKLNLYEVRYYTAMMKAGALAEMPSVLNPMPAEQAKGTKRDRPQPSDAPGIVGDVTVDEDGKVNESEEHILKRLGTGFDGWVKYFVDNKDKTGTVAVPGTLTKLERAGEQFWCIIQPKPSVDAPTPPTVRILSDWVIECPEADRPKDKVMSPSDVPKENLRPVAERSHETLIWRGNIVLVEEILMLLHLRSIPARHGIQIYQNDAEPHFFQVRTTMEIDKHKLVIYPYVYDMNCRTAEDAAKIKRPKWLHTVMPLSCELALKAGEDDGQPMTQRLFLMTPLLKFRAGSKTWQPDTSYWCVMTALGKETHNMEKVMHSFKRPSLTGPALCAVPQVILDVPYLRNTRKLKPGEILKVPLPRAEQ
jgi:hypothetical protein